MIRKLRDSALTMHAAWGRELGIRTTGVKVFLQRDLGSLQYDDEDIFTFEKGLITASTLSHVIPCDESFKQICQNLHIK